MSPNPPQYSGPCHNCNHNCNHDLTQTKTVTVAATGGNCNCNCKCNCNCNCNCVPPTLMCPISRDHPLYHTEHYCAGPTIEGTMQLCNLISWHVSFAVCRRRMHGKSMMHLCGTCIHLEGRSIGWICFCLRGCLNLHALCHCDGWCMYQVELDATEASLSSPLERFKCFYQLPSPSDMRCGTDALAHHNF